MSTPQPAAKASGFARLRQPVELKRGPKQMVGGVPQVSLLPTEIREAGNVAHHRRRLVAVVVAAAVVAGGAIVLAGTVDDAAQQRLASTSGQAEILNGQLGKFDDVRALEREIALGRSAVKVGGSTLIDWGQQIDAIEADKPSAYRVVSISASGATPLLTFAQGTTVADPRRAATVVMTLETSSVGDEFSIWLRKLRDVPAYADASATTATDPTTGVVTVTLTMHLSPAAIHPAEDTESK